jgi:hypothetical protein
VSIDRSCISKYNLVPVVGRIAQSGERFPYKEEVTGSSPVSPTCRAGALTNDRRGLFLPLATGVPRIAALFEKCYTSILAKGAINMHIDRL